MVSTDMEFPAKQTVAEVVETVDNCEQFTFGYTIIHFRKVKLVTMVSNQSPIPFYISQPNAYCEASICTSSSMDYFL